MKILLGVSGSISCYKAFDLLRFYLSEGYQVKVILTSGAEKFLKKEMFFYLGAEKVYGAKDDFENAEMPIPHIELARWCDRLVIAPASANFLSDLAHGKAQDLLSSCFLAIGEKPCLLYPAMNTKMWRHPLTQKNIETLNSLNNTFVHPPDSGLLACQEEGSGKLPDIETIGYSSTTWSYSKRKGFKPKTVLITTGATISNLDPVRYLTNPSSGKTGFYLAKKYLSEGHKVIVVCGKNSTPLLDKVLELPQYTLVKITSTEQMRAEVLKYLKQADIYISSAAICDINFKVNKNKIKKSNFSGALEYTQAPDVLADVLKQKSSKTKVVGFAAETDRESLNFEEKFQRKPVDLLVGNYVDSGLNEKSEAEGFNQSEGKYYFFDKNSQSQPKVAQLSKQELANEIFQRLEH